jgi:hypothetical protein
MSRDENLWRLHEEVTAAKAEYTVAQNEVSRLLNLPSRRIPDPKALESLRIAHQVLHEAMERYRQFIEALHRATLD